jgi:hypothetical protein
MQRHVAPWLKIFRFFSAAAGTNLQANRLTAGTPWKNGRPLKKIML